MQEDPSALKEPSALSLFLSSVGIFWILFAVLFLVTTFALAVGLIFLDALTGHVAGIDRSAIWVVSAILAVGTVLAMQLMLIHDGIKRILGWPGTR